jgi:GNAT superfamily N-acetyltransferase
MSRSRIRTVTTSEGAERSCPSVQIRPARADELELVVAIDDDASHLFESADLDFSGLHPSHPFVVREHDRWAAALAGGRLFVACGEDARPIGFASLGTVAGDAHLDQLAVVRACMRRGVGAALVAHAIAWSRGHRAIWLTTYAHVPWNRPYYERGGFSVVAPPEQPHEIHEILAIERGALPAPEQRVAMRRHLVP